MEFIFEIFCFDFEWQNGESHCFADQKHEEYVMSIRPIHT